jgi:cyanophycinase
MKRVGPVIAIGGGEDKENDKDILCEVARRVAGGPVIIATVASHEPDGYMDAYRTAFDGLGVTNLRELYLDDRREASDPDKLALFDDAAGVFFTGGDQLRITSQIGDTPVEDRVRALHAKGGLIAGTSAGASMMSEMMLVRGSNAESYRIGDLHMAPGLGLVPSCIIDQHFAERGRIGRLLGAVAHNPRVLGIGIDEDTAIIVEADEFSVIGRGAVYVVDAHGVTHSNVAEADPHSALSLHNVQLHVLSKGSRFSLAERAPQAGGPAAEASPARPHISRRSASNGKRRARSR